MNKLLLCVALLCAAVSFAPLAHADEAAATPDPVTITLNVENESGTLFDGNISVEACLPSPGSTASTTSGYCALEQSGLAATWSWYGDDAFLDTIAGTANDSAANNYWTWFSNLEMGMVALNKHQLTPGETLLVTIGRMPLKLDISAAPTVGSNSTVTVSRFAFDASYNAVWLPAANSAVHVGSDVFTADDAGVVSFAPTSTDPLEVYATLDDYLPTTHQSISPLQAPVPEPEAPAPAAPAPTGGGGSGSGSNVVLSTGNSAAALSFLLENQSSNGSIGNSMTSDWAALALAAAHAPQPAMDALAAYLGATQLSSITDFERRAMALEALGVDPQTRGAMLPIVASFDGTQFGDPSLVNDDIFALLALPPVGYTDDSRIVKVAFILSKQNTDGSWESIDLTAAAVQALAPFKNISGVSSTLDKAKEYVKSHEQTSGCFGNVYTSSWVLGAIAALGETPQEWQTPSGVTPLNCFATYQQTDGGFELPTADLQNRLWATSYAVPALLGVSWGSLLQHFPKQTEARAATAGTNNTLPQPQATTTPLIASTTPQVASTSEPVVTPENAATTTATTTTPAPEFQQTHAVVLTQKTIKPAPAELLDNQLHTATAAASQTSNSPVIRFITSLIHSVARFFKAL